RASATRPWKIMEVCGGQTHSILQFGLQDLLPKSVELLHGPGCPVCVTPVSMIDKAIAIAGKRDVIFCSFGDMLRVPGSRSDLLEVRATGGDVRIVYSPLDAVAIARANPSRSVVFFAIGFETTAPANAMAVHLAKRQGLTNFFMLTSHVTVPPVMAAILRSPDNQVQAFLGPGNVCSIMGWHQYEQISEEFKVPIVISGFEPVDILESIYRCVLQLESGRAQVENQYARVVCREGNSEAHKIVAEVFESADRQWRGLGDIAGSGYRLQESYAAFDADKIFAISAESSQESPECISGEILKGVKKPVDCPAFGSSCTPEKPLGATMVSSEGTCANYYKFRRLQEA
ncbi:MAG TPA: hydrogenase formation protein HypD, partial [Chroococcales cyanobacterium]